MLAAEPLIILAERAAFDAGFTVLSSDRRGKGARLPASGGRQAGQRILSGQVCSISCGLPAVAGNAIHSGAGEPSKAVWHLKLTGPDRQVDSSTGSFT